MTEAITSWQGRWHRLPLVALIFFFLKSVQQLVKQLYQAIPGLAAILIFARDLREYLPIVGAAVLLIFLLAVVLQYLRFTYHISEQRVQMKQGVFKRTELSLDYDRIQQADMQMPWYLRFVSLYIVRLESAGAKGQEVVLVGLNRQQAELLQSRVRAQSSHENVKPEVRDQSDVTAEVDFELQLADQEVWKIGLIQNPLIAAGLVAAFLVSNERMREFLEASMLQFIERFESTAVAIVVLLAMGLATLSTIVIAAIAVAWNKYRGYVLQRQGQRYSYRAGFLSPLQRSFTLRKLQGVKLRQGLIARALNRVFAELSQAGGVASRTERFLVPILTPQQASQFSADLGLPRRGANDVLWQRSHLWWLSHWMLVMFLLPTLLLGWRAGLVILISFLALRVLSWRKRGWYFDGEWFAVKTGLFGYTERWLPAAKMQSITYVQGPMQRRLGLASLVVSSAAGQYSVVDIPQQEAKQLKASLTQHTASCQLRWM